jgi:hypothetical protein
MSNSRVSTLLACVLLAAGIPAANPAYAQENGASIEPAESRKTIVFSPDRPERCDYFFVTEFNASVTGAQSQDPLDSFLFTDALGVMRNVGRSSALGASVDAHLINGNLSLTPTVRFKQWLGGRSSLDLSLGYANDDLEHEGVVGPIVNARYSVNKWLHLQAGGCRVRNVTSISYVPDYHVTEQSSFQVYGGAGLGGLPGVISWGAQAIGFTVMSAMASGMD